MYNMLEKYLTVINNRQGGVVRECSACPAGKVSEAGSSECEKGKMTCNLKSMRVLDLASKLLYWRLLHVIFYGKTTI